MMKFLKAFTVNNSDTNEIDVIDLSDPTNKLIASINLTRFNGSNSVATCNGSSSNFRSNTNNRTRKKVVVLTQQIIP
jgi:hypothetical protein